MGSDDDVMAGIREWATGQWEPFRKQALDLAARDTASGTLEERVTRLEAERDIERLLRRYHNLYNAGDAQGVSEIFTEDGFQVNTYGVYVGRDSIRANYEFLCGNQRYAEHLSPDPQISIDPDDASRALMTARHMGIVVPWKGTPTFYGGNYMFRTRKVDGKWMIGEMRITHNVQFDVTPTNRRVGSSRPEPQLPLNQKDLIEEQYLLALPLENPS